MVVFEKNCNRSRTFLNWTGSKMGVRLTNVTQLPPLTRPGQSAPKSHCQKITLKIESKWKHFTARTEEIITPSVSRMKKNCMSLQR